MKELWQIDSSHSGIHFSVRHMVVAKVRGQFDRWTGTVSAENGDLSAQIQWRSDRDGALVARPEGPRELHGHRRKQHGAGR